MANLARRAAAVAAASALAFLAMGTPVQANTLNGSCGDGKGDQLNAYADYTVGGDGWSTWTKFAGKPYGPGNGNSNNVNFYLYQDGAQNWTNFSPDNVHNGAWYQANSNIHMPPWSYVEIRWEGIFDWPLSGDPDCSAFGSP
jgi:hypothetical protein